MNTSGAVLKVSTAGTGIKPTGKGEKMMLLSLPMKHLKNCFYFLIFSLCCPVCALMGMEFIPSGIADSVIPNPLFNLLLFTVY